MSNRWKIAGLMLVCAVAGHFARWPVAAPTVVMKPVVAASAPAPPPALKWFQADNSSGPVMLTGGTFIDAMGAEFVKLAGGDQARLVIIPTAWEATEIEGTQQFIDQWSVWKPAHVTVLHTRDRAEADSADFVSPLQNATGVWFTGGNQSQLTDVYGGTRMLADLKKLLARGGAIGGNCAGAMAIGEMMIISGKDPVLLRPGLGLIPGLVADSHWLERNRLERLRDVIEDNPGYFGLGIDKQTAVILHEGQLRLLGNSYAATVVVGNDVSRRDFANNPTNQVRFDIWSQGDVVRLNADVGRFEPIDLVPEPLQPIATQPKTTEQVTLQPGAGSSSAE